MPKLVITITEKLVEIPGEPERMLLGLETDFNIEYEKNEVVGLSALPEFLPALQAAIQAAQKIAFGPSLHSAAGLMDAESEKTALKIVTAPEFPAEFEA